MPKRTNLNEGTVRFTVKVSEDMADRIEQACRDLAINRTALMTLAINAGIRAVENMVNPYGTAVDKLVQMAKEGKVSWDEDGKMKFHE